MEDTGWIKREPKDDIVMDNKLEPSWRFLASQEKCPLGMSWPNPPPLTFYGNEDATLSSKIPVPSNLAPLRQPPPLHHASDAQKMTGSKFVPLGSASTQQDPPPHCESDTLQTDTLKKASECIHPEAHSVVIVKLESSPETSSKDLSTDDSFSSYDDHHQLAIAQEGTFSVASSLSAMTTQSWTEEGYNKSRQFIQTVSNIIQPSLPRQVSAVCEMEREHDDFSASVKNATSKHVGMSNTAGSSTPVHTGHHFIQKPAVQGKIVLQQPDTNTGSLCTVANKMVKKQGARNGSKCVKGSAPKPRPHACPECGLAFYGRDSLQKHMAMSGHTATLSCKLCEYPFKDQESLDQHVTQQHKCQHCDRLFQFATQRTSHMKSHSAVKDAICEICGMLFATSSTLTAHRQQVHSEQRSHRCYLCGATFKITQGLQRHIKLSHTDTRSFECELCGGKFKTPYTLKKHIKIVHTGEKTHSCPCGAAFKSKAGLHQHNTHVHRVPSKSHTCPHCDRSFLSLQHLNTHRKGAHKDKTI